MMPMSRPLERGGQSAIISGIERLFDDALIIRMLILRNLRNKYRHNPLGLMLEFLQPVVLCTVHYWYFEVAGRNVPNQMYLIFVIGGFSMWLCFASSYSGTLQAAGGSAGVTNIPGITAMHICLSKAVWAFLLFFIFVYLVSFLGMIFGDPIAPPDLLLTLTTYGMAAGLGFAFGLVTKAIAEVFPALSPFLKMVRWALFITSGIYNSLSTMQLVEVQIVRYNPLIHLAEYERHALSPGYPVVHASLSYAASVLVGLLFLGLTANRALARRGRGMNKFFV